MHVLILPSWYPRFDGDAEGSFFHDQAHALAASGLKVGVVFADLKGPRRYLRRGRRSGIAVRQDGPIAEVRSHGFNWFPRNLERHEKLWVRHARRAFDVYVERFGKPDIVHVHSMEPAASFALQIADRYGIPFVITEHSTFFLRSELSPDRRDRVTTIARRSAHNIAVSQAFATKLARDTGCGWDYLPNIVSDRFLARPVIAQRRQPFRLVSVALLSRHKRMDLVIDALAVLRNRGRDVALTIVGDGRERLRLERMVAGLGLMDVVTFVGRVPVNDMPEVMAAGDVLVSASDFETFGVTLVEGMALGMPIVATRSGGPESIVTPDVGVLVDLGDAAALARGIMTVMDNANRYRPGAIRAHCETRFSPGVVCAALTSIYAKAVANAGR